jgi:DNA polymerase-3 subunit gamma/tau
MRDALSMLDQAIAFGGGGIEESGVRNMLGAIDQSYLYELLEALVHKDGARMLAIADEMEARSLSLDAALQDLAGLLHRLALAQIVPSAIDEDMPERERILALAKAFAPDDIQLFYQIAIQGRADLSRAPDEYAGFTMTLMRMLAFMPEDTSSVPAIMPMPSAPEARGTSSTTKTTSVGKNTQAAPEPETAKPLRARDTAEAASPTGAVKVVRATNTAEVASPPGTAEAQALKPGLAASSFSDDWMTTVTRLKLSGMPKMLAQHCEVKHFTSDEIEFCVPEIHRHLLDKSYQNRLQAALREHLGKPVRLKFSVGVVTGLTPAELENREKQDRQSQATAAIESDPFVRELVENFDAKLITSSIKPIQ